MNYKNMADMRICETLATQASPNLGISNNNYGPWNNMHCVQWCVSEVQGGRNVTVYSDVCLRYRVGEMLLCTVMCVWGTEWEKCYCVQSEVQKEGNVTENSDVCLKYIVEEM